MEKIWMNVLGFKICIQTSEKPLTRDLYNTFHHFIDQNENCLADIDICIKETDSKDFQILFGDRMSACVRVNLYPKVCDIIRRAIIYNSNLFCFHAAALEKNGKTFVFISTGNSGKSTLCTALIYNGYKLLTDDTCWIDPIKGIIHPYPLAIGTRHKTLELFPSLHKIAIETSFPGKLILPVSEERVASASKVFAFFNWELDFDKSEFHKEAVSFEEMTYHLLSHSYSFKYCENKTKTVNELKNTVENCRSYHLMGHNLNQLPNLLERIAAVEE